MSSVGEQCGVARRAFIVLQTHIHTRDSEGIDVSSDGGTIACQSETRSIRPAGREKANNRLEDIARQDHYIKSECTEPYV